MADIKFMHIRRFEEGSYDPLLTGGMTLAYKINKKGTKIKVASARCSNREAYNKNSGRQLSYDRLKVTKEYQVFKLIPELPPGALLEMLVKHDKIESHRNGFDQL